MPKSCFFGSRGVVIWLLALGVSLPAQALNFEWGDAQFTLNSRAVLGGALRLQSQNPNTIGKLNLNPDLCPDDCIDFTGGSNPTAAQQEPNQRLVDAPGAFLGNNFDNGNLSYDKYDFVSAQARLESELIFQYGQTSIKVSGLGFYDPLNDDFNEFHPDTTFQPAYTPRNDTIKHRVGADVDLLEAFISRPFDIFGQRFTVSVGEQRVRWGESTFVALGSLDQLNPPDQTRLNFPGSEIASVFEPVGMAVVSTNLSANVSLEAVYQYRWEPAQPAGASSFYGTNDIAGGGQYAVVSLGQFSEDPNFIGSFQNDVPQNISSSSTSVPVDDQLGTPQNGGQYGARLTWFAENLNDGTELAFYALNYHSRLPYGSTFATNESCLRDPDNQVPDLSLLSLDGIGNLLGLDLNGLAATIQNLLPIGVPLEGLNADAIAGLAACGGGTGTGGLAPVLQAAFGPLNGGVQEEPIPIGSLRPFLDYPEDIHLFGMAFNTQLGKWSLAGEYVFQPNLPLQVALSDVIFAGVQPALPEQDLNLVLGLIPSNRNAAPDAIETQFRGNTVQPNQLIRGFTREKVHQLDLTGIRVFGSSNWIGADQIVLLAELGMTYVQSLPESIRYEGGGPNCTHFSAGADGTGSDTGPDARRLNPTQSTDCFADDFAAGYRLFIRPQYNNLIFGWTFNPIIGLFHDFYGVSPFPVQNFVEDEIEVLLGTDISFTNALSMQVLYQGFYGSGDRVSLVQDRDNVQMSFSYNF